MVKVVSTSSTTTVFMLNQRDFYPQPTRFLCTTDEEVKKKEESENYKTDSS